MEGWKGRQNLFYRTLPAATRGPKNTWRYYNFTHLHHKQQSYDVWFWRYGAQKRIFCHSRPFFALFPPLTTQKIEILKNWKKKPGDIILHVCTINDNQMMYGSWDIESDSQIFLSFWTIFCHFTHQTTKNIKILKKWKNIWRYYHITHVYHKLQSHDVWFLRYRVWQTEFFVILDNFLPIYLLKTKKIRISKKWKKHLEISSFYKSVPTIMIICYTVPEIWHVTDLFIFHFRLFFALLSP